MTDENFHSEPPDLKPGPDGVADLEAFARAGKKPPKCRGYRVRINGDHFVIENPEPKGREILKIGEKTPPERHRLWVKMAGGERREVGLDETVDLRQPGVERFKSIPRDPTEGRTLRRDFPLLPEDLEYLESLDLPWEAVVDGSNWVLIHDYPVPAGYTAEKVTLAVRIEVGYPDSQLDMAYFHPALNRSDGKPIGATQAHQRIADKEYQRWSRHRTKENPWRPGVDSLETHILLVQDWLEREVRQ